MDIDNSDLKLKIDFAKVHCLPFSQNFTKFKSNTKNKGHLFPRFDYERIVPALEMSPAGPLGPPVLQAPPEIYRPAGPPQLLQPVFT